MERAEFEELNALDEDIILEFRCPYCDAILFANPTEPDLYCNQCKMIVMQDRLSNCP